MLHLVSVLCSVLFLYVCTQLDFFLGDSFISNAELTVQSNAFTLFSKANFFLNI